MEYPQEIVVSSPPPSSPLSSPPFSPRSTPPSSPESPPRVVKVRAEGLILFNKPALPLKPETSPIFVEYLVVGEEMIELHLNEVKKLILNPSLVPEEFLNLQMYVSGSGLFPAHLPQLQNVTHLPEVAIIVLKWLLRKEDGVDADERQFLHNLGPWLDPKTLLPHWRQQLQLRNNTVRVKMTSNSNALTLVKVLPMLKQATISANWGEGSEQNGPRVAEVTLNPKRSYWICPTTREAVIPWVADETEVVRCLKNTPYLPYNMSIIVWNARGIGRSTFKPNMRHLISNHYPDLVVIVETWVSRKNT